VTAGYFDAMGLRAIAGRAFSDGDSYLDGTPAVISQALAKVLWPDGADPIGHRLRIGPFSPWMAIVGVVSDVKNRSLTAPPTPELYLPFGALRSPVGVSREMTFVVRTTGPAANVQRAAQRAVLETNPDLPIYGMRRFDDIVSTSQVREVTTMRTLTAFAAIALLLAVSGAYAMLMFAVVQRRHEVALRQAIGATSTDVVGMIGREMAQLLAIGVGLGLAGTLAASRLLSRFLFGVTALDARVLAVTILVVSVAGLGAALIPARRAASVDPMLLLRS
jgi:predicted lysophospholipase L1 biosynthesis ABC-type transport system permease subunit